MQYQVTNASMPLMIIEKSHSGKPAEVPWQHNVKLGCQGDAQLLDGLTAECSSI